ncbi:MAG TPA: secretin N-terminal domain-containing protein [Thermoanaerobaculia bacterium]|nr:secretin N-terminal domain-containing protein [Thermoanaerobaculia bacterium]
MTKRFAFMLFLALAVCGTAFADDDAADAQKSLSVKTYQFKHKDADKATAVVKQLMSAEGSISIQPSTNSVVITDRPDNLKAITAALVQFDTPPKAFKLSIRLVAASRAEGPARTPDDLRDVAPSLGMRFNVLESLGSITVDGHEGEPGIVDLPTGYRADFRFGDYDPASDSVQISDFKLSKLQGDQLTPLLKTTLNLKIGQTVIFGATKPEGKKALVLVFAAKK